MRHDSTQIYLKESTSDSTMKSVCSVLTASNVVKTVSITNRETGKISASILSREGRAAILGSLSTRVFETRTATGSERFSLLTCLHTTAFALPSIFSPLEMLGIKIWKTPLSWHAKCLLPVVVGVSKTCMLKLSINPFTGYITCAYFNKGRTQNVPGR